MNRFFVKKSFFLLFLTAIFISGQLFCAPKKNKKSSKKNQETSLENQEVQKKNEENETFLEDSNGLLLENADFDKSGAVQLSAQKRTFFYKIDGQILADVENGSPESLKNAMQKIKKQSGDYEENEKVLIAVSTEIMKDVWPSQKILWENENPSSENSYLGAINSAKQGVFDSSTGNVDFLATLLPSLVILNPTVQDSQILQCQGAIEKALSLNSESVLANYLMAILLKKQEKIKDSLPFLEIAYQKSPKTEEIALSYSNALLQSGKLQLAQNILNDFDATENNISVLKQKAYVAFESKDFENAELYVAKVLQQNPNNLEFVLFRAKILVEKKDYIRAVSLLDVYARQDDSSLDYLVLRAKIQLDWSKNTTAATETVEKALLLYPENIDVLMIAAKISSMTDSPVAGKYADELTEKVLEKEPQNVEAMIFAMNALMQRENWKDAYGICKKIISVTDSSVNNSSVKKSDLEDSSSRIESFMPEVVDSFVQICLKLGKNDEAYEFSKNQRAKFPDNEEILQAYIFAYSKVGNRDLVFKEIDKMLLDSSAKMKSFLYYVRSFIQQTDDKSLADLRSSLSMNPRNSDSLFRLYEIYYEKQDYRKAQYYLRQVVAINPNNNSIRKLNEALTKLMQ